jgi:RecG-like helicase
MLYYLLAIALLKRERLGRAGIAYDTAGIREDFIGGLPFPLTGAQERVLREIEADMGRERPMNRLIQGDVGSGKTVLAFFALLVAAKNGYQGALMAPTEILRCSITQFNELFATPSAVARRLGKKERESYTPAFNRARRWYSRYACLLQSVLAFEQAWACYYG